MIFIIVIRAFIFIAGAFILAVIPTLLVFVLLVLGRIIAGRAGMMIGSAIGMLIVSIPLASIAWFIVPEAISHGIGWRTRAEGWTYVEGWIVIPMSIWIVIVPSIMLFFVWPEQRMKLE